MVVESVQIEVAPTAKVDYKYIEVLFLTSNNTAN